LFTQQSLFTQQRSRTVYIWVFMVVFAINERDMIASRKSGKDSGSPLTRICAYTLENQTDNPPEFGHCPFYPA
jgi:hypothetical protein